MKWLLPFVVAFGLTGSVLVPSQAQSCHAHHGTCAPPGAVLFDDEFDGIALNPVWWPTPWCSSSVGDQEGCYNAANAFLNGSGQLVLRISFGTMGRPYDQARIQTWNEDNRADIRWSAPPPMHLEARIKVAPGAGIWPAFWANGTRFSSPAFELDFAELRMFYPTIDTCHAHGATEYGSLIDTAVDLSADYHIYWSNYYQDHVVFGVDNLTCGQTPLSSVEPIMLRLDNVVGVPGTWGGVGGPPPDSAIPADMLVDYVRVTAL